MVEGIRTFIYPVRDLARAKTLFSKLLETDPYVESAYYIGFRIADQELGLDPKSYATGRTGPVGYWHVSDSKKSVRSLLDAGTQQQPEIENRRSKDIGQGKLIASVKNEEGNVIALPP